MRTILNFILLWGIIIGHMGSFAQEVSIKEEMLSLETYGYGKPNPVPILAENPKIYPYFKFEEYEHESKKKDWKVVGALQNDADLVKLMDDDPNTFWATDENASNSNEITLDLGASHTLTGFSYWPIQERYPFGIITKYDFLVSQDNRTWKSVSKGEFSNVVNNRIEQRLWKWYRSTML